MRDFARPAVLARSAVAALIGTAACLPRMAQWTDDRDALLILCTVLGWCVFTMWGFVFAWSPVHANTNPFVRPRHPKFWAGITGGAFVAAALLAAGLDPEYHRLFPGERPGNRLQWIAALLFNLSLQQLFLCFAPIAFFARLGASPRTTMGLTVALTLTVLTMKLNRSPIEPTTLAIIGLVLARGAIAALAVVVYRRTGALGVWWLAFLLQARHLPHIWSAE